MKSEVSILLNSISVQKDSSEEVIQKFNNTTNYFGEINEVLVGHIHDSEDVSDKLLAGVEKVKGFKFKD